MNTPIVYEHQKSCWSVYPTISESIGSIKKVFQKIEYYNENSNKRDFKENVMKLLTEEIDLHTGLIDDEESIVDSTVERKKGSQE